MEPSDIAAGVLEFFQVLILFLYHLILSIVKSLLPVGVWPRKSVAGQKVLLTGAGSGIGRLMAIEFGKLGAKLILVDVNETACDETRAIVERAGGDARTYKCNLANKEDINVLMDKLDHDIGDIDIVVNNAGIVTGGELTHCPDEKIQLTFNVNVLAHFWILKRLLPSMYRRNAGHVVTIASGASFFGVVDLVDYCSSKFAVYGMTESLALEAHAHGRNGIKYTAICPYYINTGMFDGVTTRFPNLLPILEPEYAVERIMEAILTETPMLMMPKICYILLFFKSFLPVNCLLLLADATGVSRSMDHFVGRSKKKDA